MIINALYVGDSEDLDLLNNRWYAVSLNKRESILDLITTSDLNAISSSEVHMELVFAPEPLEIKREVFSGNFFLDDTAPFGFSGDIAKETSFQATQGEPFQATYEIIHDEPYSLISDLWLNHTWESLLDGNDVISGGLGSDTLLGFAGNDRFSPNGGNDLIDGGPGIDTVIFHNTEDRVLGENATWVTTVESRDINVPLPSSIDYPIAGRELFIDGETYLIANVERLIFDGDLWAIDFDYGDHAYQAASLITACFGVDAVSEYMGVVLSILDSGSSLEAIAQLASDLQLIENEIGFRDEDFVKHIYKNVTGFDANNLITAMYASQLDANEITRSELMIIGANAPIIADQMDVTTWQSEGMQIFGYF